MKSIKIANNMYVHIFLHKINKTFEEAVLESEDYNIIDYDKAAEEYINALEDNDCIAFLEALHEAAARKIVDHWEEISPKQLKKEQYKKYLKFKI
jgi:hypothetical protein